MRLSRPRHVCVDILFESSLRGRSADLARRPRLFRRAALSLSLALSHFSLAVTEPYKLRAKLAKENNTESRTVSYSHFSARESLQLQARKRSTSKKRGMDQRVQMAIPGQPAPNIKR